jgi:hypothetical protein
MVSITAVPALFRDIDLATPRYASKRLSMELRASSYASVLLRVASFVHSKPRLAAKNMISFFREQKQKSEEVGVKKKEKEVLTEDHLINSLRLRLVTLVLRRQGLDPLMALLEFFSKIRYFLGMFLQEFFPLLGFLIGGFLQEILEGFIFRLKNLDLGGKGVDGGALGNFFWNSEIQQHS